MIYFKAQYTESNPKIKNGDLGSGGHAFWSALFEYLRALLFYKDPSFEWIFRKHGYDWYVVRYSKETTDAR